MKSLAIFIFCFLFSTGLTAKPPKHKYVRIKTDLGECVVMLYNETPLHRDNFIKLTKKRIYDGVLFHRVIKSFMIQGGDPDSKNAKSGMPLGEGSLGYTIPAEFRDSLFHKRGVIAAARDDNPEKASSSCQFYIVQGKVLDDEKLNVIERDRLKSKIPEWKRTVYKTLGGTPTLDGNYTVFGEVVIGYEMVENIAAVKTDTNDRPISNVQMKVSLLSRHQAKKIEKQLVKPL
ncbi:cyclophilin family peptidyl-prolyl cis-trans isomerase [Pedobacter sp. UYP24]